MLGEERQPLPGKRLDEPLMHGAQPRDRGEQAKPAAARGQEQFAIGGRQLVHVLAVDVVDDDDAAHRRIVEGRVIAARFTG